MRLITKNSATAATIYTIVYVMAITIISSAYSMYDYLASILWHHWIFKSITSLMVWLLIALYPIKTEYINYKKITWVVALSFVLIQVFFVIHYYYIMTK